MVRPENGLSEQLIANDTKVWTDTLVQLFRLSSSGLIVGVLAMLVAQINRRAPLIGIGVVHERTSRTEEL